MKKTTEFISVNVMRCRDGYCLAWPMHVVIVAGSHLTGTWRVSKPLFSRYRVEEEIAKLAESCPQPARLLRQLETYGLPDESRCDRIMQHMQILNACEFITQLVKQRALGGGKYRFRLCDGRCHSPYCKALPPHIALTLGKVLMRRYLFSHEVATAILDGGVSVGLFLSEEVPYLRRTLARMPIPEEEQRGDLLVASDMESLMPKLFGFDGSGEARLERSTDAELPVHASVFLRGIDRPFSIIWGLDEGESTLPAFVAGGLLAEDEYGRLQEQLSLMGLPAEAPDATEILARGVDAVREGVRKAEREPELPKVVSLFGNTPPSTGRPKN
ncbi:MAG: hypothetical protein Q7R83_04895 [bacterium]|nr:hypothetical protein [bacterium]